MKLRSFFIALLLLLPAYAEPAPQLPVKGGYERYVRISPDARNVVLDGSRDVWLWDCLNFELKRKMQNLERVLGIEFSPDGKYLVLSDYPRWVGYFDITGPTPQKTWEFRDLWNQPGSIQSAGAYDMTFSSDGRYLLLVGGAHGAQQADHMVRLLRTNDGKVLREFPYWGGGRRHDSIRNFAFATYSGGFLRASHDKLQLFAVPSGEKVKEIRLGGTVHRVEPWESGVVVHHDADGGTRRALSYYEVPSLKLLQQCTPEETFPRQTDNGSLRWERKDGKLRVFQGNQTVYEGNESARVKRWVPGGGFLLQTEDEEDLTIYSAQGQKIGSVARFCQVQGSLSVGVPGYGGPGEIVDLKSGKKLGQFDFTSGMSLSDNGQTLAVALKSGVLLIDVPASVKAGSLVPIKKKSS